MIMKFLATIIILTAFQACSAQSNEKPQTEANLQVISIIPSDKGTDNAEAQKLRNSGIEHTANQEYDLAIADFTKAIELDPKYADAYNRRGALYGNKKDNDKAIADFTNAIELAPKLDTAYLNRGSLYLIKKDYESAIDDFTKVIELDPDSYINYSIRSVAYGKMGRNDLANADLQKAKELQNKPKQ